MKLKKTSGVISREEYKNALSAVDDLMRKGEGNLTAKELRELGKKADLIEAFEEAHKMVPVPRNKKLLVENDRDKIASVLGYKPDLLQLVEFKMYQLKLNQNNLAEMLGMSASKVSQILNRKREADVPFLKGIHEKLGIDGNYILETV